MKVNLDIIKPRGVTRTEIEWADYSANPVRAVDRKTGEVGWHCRKVSAGCANCYAETINKLFGTKTDYTAASAEHVRQVLDEGVLQKLLRMKPRGPFKNGMDRPAIFIGDMNDLFYGDEADRFACESAGVLLDPIPLDLVDRIMAVCALRPDMNFLFLTKRPERMAEMFAASNTETAWRVNEAACRMSSAKIRQPGQVGQPVIQWPLPNVWLGTSVENQAVTDERIPHLLRCQAAVRFLSVEPLLGPIDFSAYFGRHFAGMVDRDKAYNAGIGWAIFGCESRRKRVGRNADHVNHHIASGVRQCQSAGIPAFVKQINADFLVSHDPAEWPEELRVRQMPGASRMDDSR